MLIETTQRERVLHLALNRPAKRNALNSELCETLLDAIENTDAAAIVLSSNGPVFCAGMDLHEAVDDSLHERLFTLIATLRIPLIAAIDGAAFGGGMGLAANAHLVIAGPNAKFGLTEINIGLWPVLIFRSVVLALGERRATELSLTGRIFTAAEAQAYGLVTELNPSPLERALELAQQMATRSALAIANGLEYANQIRHISWTKAGVVGKLYREELLSSPAFSAGVRSLLGDRS